MCEITSKVQCPDCSLFWKQALCIVLAVKGLQPSERNRQLNKERYDVLSIPNCVIKKNPSHGGLHGPTERQRIFYKVDNMLRKVLKNRHTPYWKGSRTIFFVETH